MDHIDYYHQKTYKVKHVVGIGVVVISLGLEEGSVGDDGHGLGWID